MSAVEQGKPDGKQLVTVFDIRVMKQIGDQKPFRVDGVQQSFKVSYLIPEAYRPTNGEMADYQIMRVYTNENGEVVTELINVSQDGYELTFEADEDSSYVLICDEDVPLAASLSLDKKDGIFKNVYGIIIGIALLGSMFFILLLLKRRKEKEEEA